MSTESIHNAFMDDYMLIFCRQLGPLTSNLRRYGGTAHALYLNHRQSTGLNLSHLRQSLIWTLS